MKARKPSYHFRVSGVNVFQDYGVGKKSISEIKINKNNMQKWRDQVHHKKILLAMFEI